MTVYVAANDKDGNHIPFNTSMSAMDAAKSISKLSQTEGFDAVAFSRIVAKYVDKTKGVTFESKVEGQPLSADLGSGYWIIMDESDPGEVPEDFSYSSYLLEVVGKDTLTLADKVDVPSSEKKVNGVDAVVAGLGERVTFTITAKLPADYAKYETYYLEFVDSMDDGLTLDRDSFTISYNGKDGGNVSSSVEIGTAPDANDPSVNDTTISYKINDLKKVEAAAELKAGETVVLTYTATVNENAVIREYNDAHIVYSNKPDSDGHGKTPDDTVIVFSFQLNGNKVDGNKKPLEGAGFTLYKADADGAYNMESPYRDEIMVTTDGKATFDFKQLGVGTYKLVETTVPEGFNKAPDIEFRVVEEKDSEGNATGAYVEVQQTDGSWKKMEGPDPTIDFDMPKNDTEGHIPEEIMNTDGLQLPETGGIGTTIFYIVGAILVAGAVILLVTKRRVNGAEK